MWQRLRRRIRQKLRRPGCAYAVLAMLGAATVAPPVQSQPPSEERPALAGIYRAGGLPVQPCGRNEWMLRSFETDQFCFGSNDGFPLSEQGLANWAEYSPIDDPVLRCRETFPRTPMRGRTLRISYEGGGVEIAYWFGGRWIPRQIHLDRSAAPPGTAHSDFGYSVCEFRGDTLVVRTTHLLGGPRFNDHKPSSDRSVVTERFWRAPDGQNLMMDIALDDPVNYTRPFIVNRQEMINAADIELDPSECTPSSIWAEAVDEDEP
jgi:hypothetical protein